MIRPIDTQILQPQTPKLANEQQKANRLPLEHQTQLSDIVAKETEEKRETVFETNKTEHLKTEDEKQKQEKSSKEQKKKSHKEKKTNMKRKKASKIDIRI